VPYSKTCRKLYSDMARHTNPSSLHHSRHTIPGVAIRSGVVEYMAALEKVEGDSEVGMDHILEVDLSVPIFLPSLDRS
jgi:hypothetical protein